MLTNYYIEGTKHSLNRYKIGGLVTRTKKADTKKREGSSLNAALIGGLLSPLSAGVYTGAKTDSFSRGLGNTLSSVIGRGIGRRIRLPGSELLGSATGAGLGHHFLSKKSKPKSLKNIKTLKDLREHIKRKEN